MIDFFCLNTLNSYFYQAFKESKKSLFAGIMFQASEESLKMMKRYHQYYLNVSKDLTLYQMCPVNYSKK